jgi:hypothetical protein
MDAYQKLKQRCGIQSGSIVKSSHQYAQANQGHQDQEATEGWIIGSL